MADADVNHEKIEDREKGERNHDGTPKGAGASGDKDKGNDGKEAKEDNGAGQKDAVADSGDAQGGQEEGGKKSSKLATQFKAFSKFGDTKSDGRKLTLSQSDKWMKQAKVIDGKTVTTTDTGIYFKKFKCQKITFVEFEKYLDEIAKGKKMDAGEIRNKMTDCGPPGFSGTTNAVKTSAVDRLTDASRYTGSHKLRFDEKGRGRGIAGRKDVADKSGYVQGYSNKETYNKTH